MNYDVIPTTAAEALRRWDAGEAVFTISMGGLGPGYEQCIHILVFEILRDHDHAPPESAFGEWAEATIDRVDRSLGLSGAQVGAAKGLAFRMLRDGYAVAVRAFPADRQIQVSTTWPRL